MPRALGPLVHVSEKKGIVSVMRELQILNVRAGFATNSSSSHSVLLFYGHGLRDELIDSYGFGREKFVAASESAKRDYLIGQLSAALGYRSWAPKGQEAEVEAANRRVVAVIEELVGPIADPTNLPNVDHQSVWALPQTADGELDLDFARELVEFFQRPEVVVLGGSDENDVDEPVHPLLPGNEDKLWANDWPSDQGRDYVMVARKDIDHWTLFNRQTGMKVRLTFGDQEPLYSSAPELVDVKISDYCPLGCTFCYVDSTEDGQHGSFSDIAKIADELAQAGVFEVALGGGETTMHPRFADIVELFAARGVVPNFTTRSLAWLKDKKLVARLRPHVGSFAFSVQKASEVGKLARLIEKSGWHDEDSSYWERRNPALHVVMGTVSQPEFEAILDAARKEGLGVTLLGYKRTGRATEPEHPYLDWWLASAQEHGPWRLGIDTALAAESRQQLLDAGVDQRMFHTEDGRWSAYIDAVQMTMAPSSWEPARGHWPFDAKWRQGWKASQTVPKSVPLRSRLSVLADPGHSVPNATGAAAEA
jgi:organic radical activating enzyme